MGETTRDLVAVAEIIIKTTTKTIISVSRIKAKGKGVTTIDSVGEVERTAAEIEEEGEEEVVVARQDIRVSTIMDRAISMELPSMAKPLALGRQGKW